MRWKCVCAYDGTDYLGWQSQTGGGTIQDILEEKLAAIFKKPVRIHGSGRTDSGVHAKGQVFHFDGIWKDTEDALTKAINSQLHDSIRVLSTETAGEDFHARFSAIGKRYSYTLVLGHALPQQTRYAWSLGEKAKLDISKMQAAASSILGRHDFSAFAAVRDAEENPVKELRKLDVAMEGNMITITTEGSGYLYKMVRSLVGTLVKVGTGKLSPEDFLTILEGRVRTHQVETAPAKGLCLETVFYGE